MTRELLPMTVYLSAAAKAEVEERAADKSLAAGTMLRLIILGKEPPLTRA